MSLTVERTAQDDLPDLDAGFGAPYWGFAGPGRGLRKWFDPQWVYVIASGRDERPVKIGISVNVRERIRQFEAGNPYGLRSMHAVELCLGTACQVEARLHAAFAGRALGREWFDLSADQVTPALDHLASRAIAAARRYRRELLTRDHMVAKLEARAERKRLELEAEWAAAQKAFRRQQAAARARAAAEHRRNMADLTATGTNRLPPTLPEGVVIAGNGRKARLARYMARRGLTD